MRKDVLFNDYNHSWKAVRRVMYLIITFVFNFLKILKKTTFLNREYVSTEKQAIITSGIVDETIENMVKLEGLNKTFDSFDYIYNMFFNILAFNTIGKRLLYYNLTGSFL